MKEILKQKWTVPVAAPVLVLALGTVAFAATGAAATDATTADDATAAGRTPDGATSTGDMPWGHQRGDETLLTGDILSQVQATALAEVGSDATVIRAETDADGNAAYEVHMVKTDGTPVTVYVDESFKVVSTQEGAGDCGAGRGHVGMGHQRSDETPLTGDTLAKVQAAALAEVGTDATVIRAETDGDGNAAYEVHVQKADGTRATVYVDESFSVVSVEDQPVGDPGHHHNPSDSQTGTTDNPTPREGSTPSDTI